MAKAMIEMYENYSKYDAIAIAQECRKKFAPDSIARQLTDIFTDTISRY